MLRMFVVVRFPRVQTKCDFTRVKKLRLSIPHIGLLVLLKKLRLSIPLNFHVDSSAQLTRIISRAELDRVASPALTSRTWIASVRPIQLLIAYNQKHEAHTAVDPWCTVHQLVLITNIQSSFLFFSFLTKVSFKLKFSLLKC